jgi:hypothetical protein
MAQGAGRRDRASLVTRIVRLSARRYRGINWVMAGIVVIRWTGGDGTDRVGRRSVAPRPDSMASRRRDGR